MAKRRKKVSSIERFLKGSAPKPRQILVAMPSYRAPQAETVSKLYGTMMDFMQSGIAGLSLQITYGSSIHWARTKAIKTVLEQGFDAVFFVDDDHDWPLSAGGGALGDDGKDVGGFNPLTRLWSHDKDIVGTLATSRKMPLQIMAGNEAEDGWCRFLDKPEEVADPTLRQIDFVGFAMCLIRRRAILRMLAHYSVEALFTNSVRWRSQSGVEEEFQHLLDKGAPRETLFDCVDKYVEQAEQMGEDFSFCKRARNAGCEVWLDPSFEVTHLGTYHYSRRDWLALYQQQQENREATEG